MKRLGYIDVAKGICMLLIMLGHCSADTGIRESSLFIRWVYSYHVTAFFIITGLLMEHIHECNRDFKKVILLNFKHIMIPYYLFQISYVVSYGVIKEKADINLLNIIRVLNRDHQYATWFLITLFFAKIVYIAIKKTKFHPEIFIYLIFCAGFVLPYFKIAPPFPFGRMYMLFLRISVACGFIHSGCVLYRFREYLFSYRVLICSLTASVIVGILNGYTSTYNIVYGNPLLYTVSGLCGTIFILCLSTHIKSKFLSFFGKNSIIPLGTHELFLYHFKPNILNYVWIVPIVTVVTYLYVLMRNIFHKLLM